MTEESILSVLFCNRLRGHSGDFFDPNFTGFFYFCCLIIPNSPPITFTINCLMASCHPLQDVYTGKPLFMAVFAGILLFTIIIASSLYSSTVNGDSSRSFFFVGSRPGSPVHAIGLQNESTNVNIPTNVNISGGNFLTRAIWDLPPPNSEIPDLTYFRLTREMVGYRAKDNVIVVTFGNYAFMDFILNWVKHLTDINVFNILVGAMDTKLLVDLYWKGVPVFDMGSNMNTMDVGWGSPTFHKMGREKVFLINKLLPFGYELLLCDTDMVWLKNPLPYFARFPEADLLTSSDQLVPTVTDDSLEVWKQVNSAYNIGIFHWRPTNSSKKFAKEWRGLLVADEKIWDQNGFNDLIHKVLGPSVEDGNGLVYAFDGILKLGILPASIFCSGHTYFVQSMYQQLRLDPYAVHTTFQYAGTEGKRHRLREAMLFHDAASYYDSPGGFVYFKPNIPKALLLDGAHTLESHFSLVNYQLKQIRAALAIASLVNRTLVMPPIWCRFDRIWYGHPGILEGTLTRQPFLCPMDHVFEINVMLRDQPEQEFGRKIDFREYSFLQNPRLSKQVKESFLEVQLCDPQSSNCRSTNQAVQHGFIRLPKHNTQEKMLEFFSLYKNVKVIEFSSMVDAFEGYSDKAAETRFRNRVKEYVGIWCCVMHKDPGHIFYDMYWDEKPGWKPEPGPRS